MAFFSTIFLVATLLLSIGAYAQDSAGVSPHPTADDESPKENSGKTTIQSDRLEVINTDCGNRFIFSGAVLIQGEDFVARCEMMEVKTDSVGEDDFGAISMIKAAGGVTIQQGDRTATAGRALIDPRRNEVVLEDSPRVEDSRGSVSGYRMVLRGADRKITVESGPDGQQPRVELPSLEAINQNQADD